MNYSNYKITINNFSHLFATIESVIKFPCIQALFHSVNNSFINYFTID